ncbi:ATP phosphoribosyltransferase 2 [Pyrus ussuriensis x Pyrus communis]|uniref:ATP phosphoribosyltransferase 2 n=1 Tax=Pyrus ussuriensis x Pyrus communis TaxID=2448454 RepID=A0A5N5FLV5_9ROSA|nr:ATP phosphoribosyltransferase 2 [Pyrus ussuriensis x Pyrus communis]
MLASNLPKSTFFPTQYVPISRSFHITCSISQLQTAAAVAVNLPSKGRMAANTLDLLKDCQLSVKHVNPHQYVAQIPQVLI